MNATTPDTSRRRKPTLRRELRLAIVGSMMLIVALYSAGLILFFFSGVDLASWVEMKGLAASYKEELARNPNPSNPVLRNVLHAYAYTDLPQHIQAVFADETIELGTPIITADDEGEFPNTIFMLLAEPLSDGQTLYLARELHVHPSVRESDSIQPSDLEFLFYTTGISTIVLILILAFWLNRRIQGPIIALQAWAGDLRGEEATHTRPDFRYQELNDVAARLSSSIHRIEHFVRREQDFLRQASHELRTPIAVISGNVSVLDETPLSDIQKNVSARIGRASQSMQHIVTTLLWLGREDEPLPPPETVDLAALVRNTVTSHDYLLTGKNIRIETDLPPTTIAIPVIPLEIAAANMIRNGFQHTEEGRVVIRIDASSLTVENTVSDQSQDPAAGLVAGGGVGLNLIRRIADRLGWQFSLSVAGPTVTARLELGTAG